MEKEWSWRDSGKLGLSLKLINTFGELTNFGKKGFNPEQIISKAIRKSGLDDFGGNSFQEGLEVICQAYSSEGQCATSMNFLGRMFARITAN